MKTAKRKTTARRPRSFKASEYWDGLEIFLQNNREKAQLSPSEVATAKAFAMLHPYSKDAPATLDGYWNRIFVAIRAERTLFEVERDYDKKLKASRGAALNAVLTLEEQCGPGVGGNVWSDLGDLVRVAA